MADYQAGGRIVMWPWLGPKQPVSGHEMAVETGCLGQRRLADPPADMGLATKAMAQKSDRGHQYQDADPDENAGTFHPTALVGPGSALVPLANTARRRTPPAGDGCGGAGCAPH